MRRYRIVVGVDLTEYSEIVLEHALDQAARHQSPELHILHVRERSQRKRSLEEMRHYLSSLTWPALQTFNRHYTNWRARLHVRTGKPDIQICTLATDVLADMIVIGQFGLHKALSQRIVRMAPCPTLVVGMPYPMQESPICNACAAVREDTDGHNWFCAEHHAPNRVEHVVTPMTTWSGGSLM